MNLDNSLLEIDYRRSYSSEMFPHDSSCANCVVESTPSELVYFRNNMAGSLDEVKTEMADDSMDGETKSLLNRAY